MDAFTCKLTIENRNYGMLKMPPIDAAPFATRVLKALSGIIADPKAVGVIDSFSSMIETYDIKPDQKDVKEIAPDQKDVVGMGLSMISLFSKIDPDELDFIFKKAFNSDVFIENDRLSDEFAFQKHFDQYAQDYYPVAIWIVINNVKPFLKSVGGGIQAAFQSLKARQAPTQK